ncbi:hypothetical protein [Leucobacter chromiireducens]|uniref:hypothetical protein n=1 Tax=Leucobacter chromiireducens TaxID=283877 RepID=UPI003F81D9BF
MSKIRRDADVEFWSFTTREEAEAAIQEALENEQDPEFLSAAGFTATEMVEARWQNMTSLHSMITEIEYDDGTFSYIIPDDFWVMVDIADRANKENEDDE